MRRQAIRATIAVAIVLGTAGASAQHTPLQGSDPEHPGDGHAEHANPVSSGRAAATHETAHEASGHGHDPSAPPKPINWIYGFIGKDDSREPSLLWRKSDMDPPFAAVVLNFALFVYIIYRFAKKPLQESLVKRRDDMVREMKAAQKMKEEAELKLASREKQLREIDQEIARTRQEYREQGEREKQRIIREAEEKRERMLRDAAFLIEQEAKQMQAELLRETVEAAAQAAEEMLRKSVTATDQDRLTEQYLKEVAASRGLGTSKGGSA